MLLCCIYKVTPEKRKRLFNYYTYTEHADNVGGSTTANERKLTDEITLVSLPLNDVNSTIIFIWYT
jgi:hypothetical protein